MDVLEKNLLRVDLAIKRHAFLKHFRGWLNETLDRVKKANAGTIGLPEFMTEKYIDKLKELRVEIEQQLLRDGEAVLKDARDEHC